MEPMSEQPSVVPSLVAFVAGTEGLWRIDGILAPKGDTLPPAARLAVVDGDGAEGAEGRWALRGMVAHGESTHEAEDEALVAKQEPLGRPEARCAALIAVRKSPAWWALSLEERRAVVEDRSHHTAVGLEYLPAIARRMHHAHELNEPFDVLSWFEYAPADQDAFDELVGRLRDTAEWSFVEREVDVRVTR